MSQFVPLIHVRMEASALRNDLSKKPTTVNATPLIFPANTARTSSRNHAPLVGGVIQYADLVSVTSKQVIIPIVIR